MDLATFSLPVRERPINTGCCRRDVGGVSDPVWTLHRCYIAREGSVLVNRDRRPSSVLTAIARSLLLGLALVTALTNARSLRTSEQKPVGHRNGAATGQEIFVKYCASCQGTDGVGNGPAAMAMKTPPPDLTALTRRHEGKCPAGYVGALLKFGRSLASHGSEEMPVWGLRLKEIDPVRDPSGQQHIDDVVAYIA